MTSLRGVDSYSPVTDELVRQASSALGRAPAFWGRYFTSVASGGAEYRHRSEGPILAAYGIRVLPVARQTNRVSGSYEDGLADGARNACDLVASFDPSAFTGGCRVFLDIEGAKPSILSSEYWRGWDAGLASITRGRLDQPLILPCAYGLPGDETTWAAITSARSLGARCSGVWLSRPWLAQSVREPQGWTPGMLAPYRDIAGVPLLLWQYAFPGTTGQAFDRDISAPDAPDGWETTLPMPTG